MRNLTWTAKLHRCAKRFAAWKARRRRGADRSAKTPGAGSRRGRFGRARERTGWRVETQPLRWARNRLVRIGMRRAQHLGWPNTYTFTKSLGESVLAARGKDLPIAIVRPSIVESSERSPFSGWNEGINTSGPLSYLLGTNFRQLPTNARKCLDVIPVDMVCRGMSLIAAAVIARCNARMYQLATSAVNPVNMGRSIELTGLAHRKHYRMEQSVDNWLKVKFETIPVSKQRYERMSIPMQKAVVSRINRVAIALKMKKPPLARAERDLNRAEKLIELYEPFILHNDHVFECENTRMLSAALPADESAVFEFAPEAIDWWDYWINVHIPALRRWCYPLMEGRPLESRAPRELDWTAAPTRPRFRIRRPADPHGGPPNLMAIFVTGSTGYLGSYLVAGLVARAPRLAESAGAREIGAGSARAIVEVAATPF